MIEIVSNGSKWAGEEPDSIDCLLDVLGREPLDPRFEKYGNFIQQDTPDIYLRDGESQAIPGAVIFFGNFYQLSHVFRIRTDEKYIIDALTAAIRANQTRADYRVARAAMGFLDAAATALVSAVPEQPSLFGEDV